MWQAPAKAAIQWVYALIPSIRDSVVQEQKRADRLVKRATRNYNGINKSWDSTNKDRCAAEKKLAEARNKRDIINMKLTRMKK